MADAGSFNADLGINMQFNIDGAGLTEITKTIKEISKGKDLQRYWKDVESATDNASKAIERYSKNVNSKGLAENLLKQINALKALTKKENLSELFPNMELNLDELVESAKKIVPKINSEFSVDSFSQAFKTFDLLKEKALDLREVFNMLANYSDLVSRNSELSRENSQFRELIGDSDVEEVKSKLSEIKRLRDQAEEIFTSFLKVNNVERTDDWGDEKFSDYFDAIRKGSLTATEAISRFKTEYAYLLEKGFKSNNDTFGLEQLQAFSNKLDSIFRQVEETSTKINDIISNGVITKSVENLSMDSSLSDSQRSLFGNLLKDEESLKSITALFHKLIEESNKTSKVDLFNDEQLQQVLSIFDKMEGHLSSLRSIISDVGDGGEFSPLLSTIDKINISIKELSTSVKGIGLNMNIDVGSDGELDRKLQTKVANALQAYQKLFNNIKMSSAGGSFINQEFFDFNLDNYDTAYQKLKAIVNFIKKQRAEAKKQFNGYDALYEDSDKSLWKSAQAYLAQVTKAETEIKKANSGESNPLENLFGNTKDLSEVIEQLNKVVEKLNEISSSATEFKNIFKEGFNVTASVEEIDKLTNRVRELEDELSKIKLNHVNVDKSNISSDVVTPIIECQNKLQEELKETENTITKVYRAYNKMSGIVGEAGISWFSDDLDTMKTYMNHYKDRELVSGDIDINKLLSIDAQGSKHNAITYLGDYSDEASIKITDLYNKIQQLKSELSKAPNDALTQQLKELELEYDKLSEDTSNLYGTHTTNWFAIQAKEAGYLGIAIKNVVDDYDGLIDKPTTTIALFDTNLLENQEKITSRIRENVENIKGLNFDVSKAVETDANSFVNNISPEDLNDEIREIQEFNSLMKLTKITSEELGSSLREVFSYAHENPDVLDNLYDYNPNLVDVFDKNTNIGKYFDELVSSTNWDVDESSLESIYLDFAKKLQDYENKYIESVKQKLNIISNNIQSDNTSTEETISSNNSIQNELKETQEQAEQTAKAVQDISETQIKDVFQGDKIEQATTSAKELDKTLEQVDIPTDSFDDVLSKLDLTESKLKEIVKITKQSVSDSEGKFHDSYTLKDKRGSTEIYGLSSNTEKGQLLRSNIVGYDAKEIEQEAKALNQAWEEANKVNNALNETKNTLSSLPRMTELDTQFSSLDAKLSSLNSELTSGRISVADYKKEVKSLTSEYSKLVTIQQNRDVETYKQNVKAAEQEAKAIERMNNELKSYNNQVPKKPADGQRSDKFEGLVQNYKNAIDEAQKYLDNLGDSPVTEEVKKKWKELTDVIEQAKKEMDAVPNAGRGSDEDSRTKEIDKLTKYLEKNTRISKEAREQLEGYLALLKSGDPSVNVKEIHTAWTKVAVAEREAGREGKSFLDIFKNKVVYNYAAQLAGYFLSFMDIIRYAREGIDTLKEFDDGLTKISYTMDITKSQLNDLGKSVLDTANDIDSSIDNAMQVSQIYANMNTSAEEIKKLSEPTLILSNLTGFDASTVADDIQAVTQQFEIAAEESMHIADVYDQISRNISVDYSKGIESIAEAVQVSGSTAKQAGLSFEQLAAIVGKTAEKTRLDGSQIGNGLKTIMTRLSKVGELSDEVDPETLSDASESLHKIGIEVYNADGSFRKFDVIMGELANKWDTLSDAEKSNISFSIAA